MLRTLIPTLSLLAGTATAFEAGPKTTAHWKFDAPNVEGNGFKNLVPHPSIPSLPWTVAPQIVDFEGTKGVQVSRTAYGTREYHVDFTAGNSEKVISYGARIKLDTMRKDYSSFVAGFYDSHRFMVDTMGRFHLGIQNVGVKRAQQWLRTDSEQGQPLVEVKKWHEVVFTIDARDPGRVLGYFFLDGKQQRNPHFAVNDDGVRTTGMNPFQVGKDPSDPGPPWYGSPLHGLISELIIEKGYLIQPTLPHTGPLNNRVNLGTQSVSARPGDTVRVPVLLTNYSDLGLSSCQFTLRVKPEVLQVLAVERDGIAKDWILNWNDQGGGAYRIALGGAQQPMRYGEGAILNLTLKVREGSRIGDFSDLALDDVKLDENRQLEVSTTTGRIRVEEDVLYGDADGDGKVDLKDAVMVFAYVVEALVVPDSQLARFTKVADVSGHGGVTSYDAALILQHAAGLLPDFPVARKPVPLPKAAARGGAATLTLSQAKDLGNGLYEYTLQGQNLHGFTGAEMVLSLDSAKAQAVESASTSLRGARLSGVSGPGRYALTLAVNDRFQDLGNLAVFKVKQNAPGQALGLVSAYINEGAITGDFKSAPVRGGSLDIPRTRERAWRPGIRQTSGFLEAASEGSARLTVVLRDPAGRILGSETGAGPQVRIPLALLPRGMFFYEVSAGGKRFTGRAVRL